LQRIVATGFRDALEQEDVSLPSVIRSVWVLKLLFHRPPQGVFAKENDLR
jgi:hypothetical protein